MHADIDIDIPDIDPKTLFPWTRASLVTEALELRPHTVGLHPQKIPVDDVTGLSAIPYADAEVEDFFKVDFLHVKIYDLVQSRRQVEELVSTTPDWGLLLVPDIQTRLFQIGKHGDLITDLKPRSVEEIADIVALIRPGKRQYAKLYKADKQATRKILYGKSEDGYSFKKSHAIAYALVIVLQLNLMRLGIA